MRFQCKTSVSKFLWGSVDEGLVRFLAKSGTRKRYAYFEVAIP